MDLVERVQYKAALIVTGCLQGTSREGCMRNWVGNPYPTGSGSGD